MHRGRKGFLVLLRQQVFLLGAYQVRAVDCEKPLPFAHVLPGGIGKDVLNPPGKARLHVSQALLIDIDIAGNLKLIPHILELNDSRGHADLLQPLRPNLNRRKRWVSGALR